MRHRPTRLLLIALASAAALTVVGCGDEDEPTSAATTETTASKTRTIRHDKGTTEIPGDPKRIVTLTDQNALLPLLELGVKPVASAGQLLEGGKGRFRRTEGFDTSGIGFVGDFTAPDIETIAAQRPDLVVGYEFNEDIYEETSRLAPTVLVNIFERPLPEVLQQFAEVVGREDRAAELKKAYDERIAELKEKLAPIADELTVATISAGGQPSAFARADTGQALSAVLQDLGIKRPAQQTGDANIDGEDISLERLRDHDADVVLVIDYSGDGQSEAQPITRSRAYRNLAATKAEQAFMVDGTRTVGAAWARMGAFIDVLEQRLLAPDLDTDVVP